jgi:hypothetical protein
MTEDYEYFRNKRADRVYLSKSLRQLEFQKDEHGNVQKMSRAFRIVSKIVEAKESHQFIKDGREIVLRVTDGDRQEIKAKFYEDTRGIFTLTIQKYTRPSGVPHQAYFTFTGSEIATLYNFLRNIEVLPLSNASSQRLDDKFVEELVLTREQLFRLIDKQPDLVAELLRNEISARDVAELGHRRAQLAEFGKLLKDSAYVERIRATLGGNKRVEDVWQAFFERNSWIFGYGLNYFFNSSLEGKRLEQLVRGHDVAGSGKRVDALLRTRGIVSSLSFGEIKTHTTELMKKVTRAYRAECWQVSDELSGGIAQVQKTVQLALENIGSRLELTDEQGDPTGEQLHLYQPKAFLVIGSLAEFQSSQGLNRAKYSSFELFRRSVTNPEIITFDELYERARFIVESGESKED